MDAPRLISVDLSEPGREVAQVSHAVELAALVTQGWTVGTSWLTAETDEAGRQERAVLWLLLMPPREGTALAQRLTELAQGHGVLVAHEADRVLAARTLDADRQVAAVQSAADVLADVLRTDLARLSLEQRNAAHVGQLATWSVFAVALMWVIVNVLGWA